MTADVLERFSPATREWFRSSFAAPTAAQAGAWDAISSGQHTLVVAPTGSGKTLSAFLWALDRLASEPVPDKRKRCRVLYISPLKALAVDVERNLRSPLVGIGHAATRLGLARPDVRVAVRSGDTPADERRAFAREPADILITTPESLFLLLTSAAREALSGIETVIVDEVHAVAGTKRGAHLALSLERLDALLERPAQRIGLSATVRPVEEVARFLAGGRDVAIVAPPSEKRWDLEVVVPVPDLGAIGQPTGNLSGAAAGDPERTSVWPHVEERIVDQIAAHSSTLVFVNSRRLAERLTARLNELWLERLEAGVDDSRDNEIPGHARDDEGGRVGTRAPAEKMAQSAIGQGAPPVLARAHHGSVSREQRQLIEEDLKAGRLPAVVATSSLELGIDMGAVDLVIQVEAPPSVASGLQRVGRAGHQVGATSHGVLFPKFRGDLVQTAVITERMRAGAIEALRVPANPLDVLAQQVVAMVALDDWSVADLEALVRRAAPFSGLTRGVLESVLDMLSGRYPSDEFAELRPRLVWDRATGTLTGRRGAQRLAVTSGGTIPDRGLYGVFLAGDGAGRRVGELDEEMVYESRVGDVFALGTSSWRIEDITHDRVLVTPAPGVPARLPFWKGDTLGRPAELGEAVGAFVREIGALSPEKARARAEDAGLDEWAADNLLGYLAEQTEAIGRLPHDRQLVVERFRDEIGDWRVVVHSPYGAQVHAPWALVVAARLRERYGVDVQAMHADDGLVFRLPDTDWLGEEPDDALRDPTSTVPEERAPASVTKGHRPSTVPEERAPASVTKGHRHSPSGPMDELLDILFPDPDEVAAVVTQEIGGSALFASRFRECAGRALLLPKRRPGQRQALWQQRLRASQLLEVASQYPSFPIVLEAVRECVNDVFDVPGLIELLRGVRSRRIATVAVETPHPSPFASSLMFGYVAQFLYEGDSPLAERRAAALALDPSLLAELLGTTEGLSLAELLDPDALTRTERELQHLDPGRRARDADDLTDILRELGPLGTDAVAARCDQPDRARTWLADLVHQRRVLELPGARGPRWAVVEDAGRLRDALGVPLPPGVPQALLEPVPDPLGDLLARYARSHTVFTTGEVAAWLGIGASVARDVLRRLVASGRLVEGDLRPVGWLPPSSGVLPAPGEASGEPANDGVTTVPEEARGELANRGTSRRAADTVAAALRDAVPLAGSRHGSSGTVDERRSSPELAPGTTSEGASPPHPALAGEQFCDARVLRLLRRRSLAALREAVEPVSATDFARFLPAWQGVGELRGVDGVLRAVEQLAGVPVPASALESLVLPARVRDYRPAMLDELTSAGEVLWQGHGALAGSDGWVSLHPAELAPLTLAEPQPVPDDLSAAVLDAIGAGGWFFRPLADQLGVTDDDLSTALWNLVWAGRLGNDTVAPLRALLGQGHGAHRSRAPVPARGRIGAGRYGRLPRAPLPRRTGPPEAAGRWSALPAAEPDPTSRAFARAELLLDRYGVVTRGSAAAEDVPGGFAGVYRVLAAAEETGRVRRGYFVEGLGAAQFGGTGAVDRLRALARPLDEGVAGPALVLAAADPANPYGAALAWPNRPDAESRGHLPGRKAGALVVLVDGRLVLYVERGGRTLLSWSDDPALLEPAAVALAGAVHAGALGKLTVERVDGESVLGSDSPLALALASAGFGLTPRGLRLRR
ncbi:MAG: DEAD/DEAH box helicase [Propionicimonas sp.]|uniref:Lhr family ATP-dependent helicase n=1 Tax=Propionicimonas sp. TaxID=1955623 RepID=UPI003D0A5A83